MAGYEDEIARMWTRYCIDDEFMEAVVNRGPSGFTESTFGYILTTGGNWAGPIDRFSLTVQKNAERELISFCGKEESEQTGPLAYTLRKTDYVPQGDLSVLILWPLPE